MSDARGTGDVHVVDLAEAMPDSGERARLISWGAAFLQSTDEDSSIRAASLALEMRDLFYKQARARGLRPTFWQVRLQAVAFVTACVRYRAEMMQGGENHVRH